MKKLLFISIIIIFILTFFIIYNNNQIDYFNNLEENLYSYDTCCSDKQKMNCMKYGKTGVCNYNKKDESCFCQNAY